MHFRRNILFTLVLALQAPDRASIEGIVTKAGTNEPVPRASIIVTMIQGQLNDVQTIVADDGGRFTVRNLVPGNHRVFAIRDGFMRGEYGQRNVGKGGVPLEVAAGKMVSGLGATLTPTSTIRGRIVNASNDPVSNVTVKALKPAYHDGERTLQSVLSAQTDDRGEYRLFGLTPGNYFLRATPARSPSIQAGTVGTPSGIGARFRLRCVSPK